MERHHQDPPSNTKLALEATALQTRQPERSPIGTQTLTGGVQHRRRCLRDPSTPKQNSLQLPAFTYLPRGQEHPMGRPGRRLGFRGDTIIPNAQQASPTPCRQGCKCTPADAANRPSVTHFTHNTPPPTSPQNKTHTQKQKETRQEKPDSNSTTISSVFIPRRRLLCPLSHPPPRRTGAARCPFAIPCQEPAGPACRGRSLLI